ncbi:MAG: DUF2264 domain-containing protein [Firmicutes bacterium]|nr:DUF2264 domain-containing protein [Bacillota bacterium]
MEQLREVRMEWVRAMERIVRPVLESAAEGRLQETMPLRGSDLRGKKDCTYLEALGRTVCGIAPWLELETDPAALPEEAALQAEFRKLTRQAIVHAVRPDDPARLNFEKDHQPIVDAAFLAEGILRATRQLWDSFADDEKNWICEAMEHTRTRKPYPSNWLLFSAMIEALLRHAGRFWDPMRVDYAFRQMEQWYLGDGVYSDGARYAWDYYNSIVIHPMLVDLSRELSGASADWDKMIPAFLNRAARYASHLERMIMPDGTYPVIGRSSAYRFGIFHDLAQSALLEALPPDVSPAGVRCGMTAVLEKLMKGTEQADGGIYDEAGFLRIGIVGEQPGIGEPYISTGSLYMCTVFFLPLGLGPDRPFWNAPDEPFTQKKIWQGTDIPCDHAVH